MFCAFLSMMLFAIGPGCKAKEGCGLEDKYKDNMENPKKSRSGLWSKKQTKRKR